MKELRDDWLERVEALECLAVDIDHRALDEARVAEIRDEEYRVLTYTANDPGRAESLLAWGVDSVITDAVDIIRPD
jgi:glycerophosphoryl diester phosphodiesterase